MVYVSYDPFHGLRTFNKEVFSAAPENREVQDSYEIPLAVDIQEQEAQIILSADVPGVDQKSIQVNVDKGVLTISGERKPSANQSQESFSRQERPYGRFKRSFKLSDTTMADKIEASNNNGVLEIRLPKQEQAKPRQIPVVVH